MDTNQNNGNNGTQKDQKENKKPFLIRIRDKKQAFCEKHPRIAKAGSVIGTVIGVGAVSAGAAYGTVMYMEHKKPATDIPMTPDIPAAPAVTEATVTDETM